MSGRPSWNDGTDGGRDVWPFYFFLRLGGIYYNRARFTATIALATAGVVAK